MQPANELDRIKLRRYENILIVSGMGVIAFALWSIVRAAIYYITQPIDIVKSMGLEDELEEFTAGMGAHTAHTVLTVVSMVAVFLVLAVDVSLRVYVGRSAFADGRAKNKKTPVYIVLAVLMAISLIWTTGLDIYNAVEGVEKAAELRDLDTASVSNILNITSLLALVELVIASIMVRRLRKKLGIRIGRDGIVTIEDKQSKTETDMLDTGMFDTGVSELNTAMHEAAGDLSGVMNDVGLGG